LLRILDSHRFYRIPKFTRLAETSPSDIRRYALGDDRESIHEHFVSLRKTASAPVKA
jgi:hypothetical protein